MIQRMRTRKAKVKVRKLTNEEIDESSVEEDIFNEYNDNDSDAENDTEN